MEAQTCFPTLREALIYLAFSIWGMDAPTQSVKYDIDLPDFPPDMCREEIAEYLQEWSYSVFHWFRQPEWVVLCKYHDRLRLKQVRLLFTV